MSAQTVIALLILLSATYAGNVSIRCHGGYICEAASGGCLTEQTDCNSNNNGGNVLDTVLGWQCNSEVCENETSATSSDLYPEISSSSISAIGKNTFKLSLSWLLKPAGNPLTRGMGGYALWVTKNTDVIVMCCTPNTTLRMAEVVLINHYNYAVDLNLTLFGRASSMLSVQIPSSCHDIPGSDLSVCPLPQYGPPLGVTVMTYLTPNETEGTLEMDANISWLSPLLPGPQYLLPALYYIDINGETYFKTNATSVLITGLNASMEHSVLIEAYVPGAECVCSEATYYQYFSSSPSPPPPSSSSSSSQLGSTVGAVVASSVGLLLILSSGVALRCVMRKKSGPISSVQLTRPCENGDMVSDIVSKESMVLKSGHPSCLVVYSQNTPSEEKEVILQNLIKGLSDYGVEATSHDWSGRAMLPFWLEANLTNASVVLCVCNNAFHQEWLCSEPTDHAVVHSVKQLLGAELCQNKDVTSKYAVVLMKRSHQQLIPSQYLKACRKFYVTDVTNIAHFIKNVPLYSVHM